MERRIITTQLEENENVLENHLRPQYLSEYIGQEKAKEILKVYICLLYTSDAADE